MQRFLEAAVKPWLARNGANSSGAPALIRGDFFDHVAVHDLLPEAEAAGQLGFWKYLIEEETVLWTPGVFAIHDLEPGRTMPIDNALAFYPPHHRPMVETALAKAVAEGTPYDLELDFTSACGRRKRVRTIGKAEQSGGKVTALYGIFQDVTRSYEQDRQLRNCALEDPQSHLPNRRHLQQFFSDLALEVAYPGTRFALALIGFSCEGPCPDRNTLTGDMIAEVAARLQTKWLQGSFAARMGSREFALLIRAPELLDTLPATGEKLLRDFKEALDLFGNRTCLKPAIGIAYVEQQASKLSQVLSTADSVLYMAKRGDRGECVIAQDGDIFLDVA